MLGIRVIRVGLERRVHGSLSAQGWMESTDNQIEGRFVLQGCLEWTVGPVILSVGRNGDTLGLRSVVQQKETAQRATQHGRGRLSEKETKVLVQNI